MPSTTPSPPHSHGLLLDRRPLIVSPQGIARDFRGAAPRILDLVYRTTGQSLAGTSVEGNAITIMTLSPLWFDGKTEVLVECYVPYVTLSYGVQISLQLDGVTFEASLVSNATGNGYEHFLDCCQYITPSAGFHTIRCIAYSPGGGSGANAPMAGSPYISWLMATAA